MGAPQVLTHSSGVIYYAVAGSNPATFTLNTQQSGSTLISFAAGNLLDLTLSGRVTDNPGNYFKPLLPDEGANNSSNGDAAARQYISWQDYGMIAYAATGNVSGGDNHIFSKSRQEYEEMSFCVVEVSGAERIKQYRWNYKTTGQTLQSLPVSSTVPSIAIAAWFGDGFVGTNHTATPSSGWTLLGGYGIDWPNGYVQFFYAYKIMPSGGIETCTWTETPDQGGHLPIMILEGIDVPPLPMSISYVAKGSGTRRLDIVRAFNMNFV